MVEIVESLCESADLKPGDSLLVRFGYGSKGLMAAEVRRLETSLPASH